MEQEPILHGSTEPNPNKFAENFMQFAGDKCEKLEEIGEKTLDEIAKILGQMNL